MHLATINFGTGNTSQLDEDQLRDKALWYLGDLERNGQIYQNFMAAWTNDGLVAHVEMSFRDSLAKKHNSKWGNTTLEEVREAFGCEPSITIIEDTSLRDYRPNVLKRSTSLYLFTHFLTVDHPIRSGDTGSPIPLYLLKLADPTPDGVFLRDHVVSWCRSYRAHDSIWLSSGELEMKAYRQLADPMSELSESGREICAGIESWTSKPTYYYLMRYWGRAGIEEKRRCPGCGRKWAVPENMGVEKTEVFFKFHFRCETCRLVSHCAVSCEDERHARIGEYRRKRKKTSN